MLSIQFYIELGLTGEFWGVFACLAGQAGMLNLFWYAGKNNKKIKYFKVWQDGNDAQEIHTTAFLDEKMNYIHNNPVKSELVANPEDYFYSSALDYSGEKGLVKILFAWVFEADHRSSVKWC